jgi:hypothetical protein
MSDGKFHWDLIDHRLVALKLTNLAEEMSESTRAEIGQIRLNNIGNNNSQAVPTQIIAMHLRRTEESIEETYRAYCEVWEKQGHEKSADFIRAVSNHAIPTIISARTLSVVSQLSQERARTGTHIEPHNARMESFKRSMSLLAARWARKLEIEARECAHSERANRFQVSQKSIGNVIRRRQEHEAALSELEREEARLAALDAPPGEARGRVHVQSVDALAAAQRQQWVLAEKTAKIQNRGGRPRAEETKLAIEIIRHSPTIKLAELCKQADSLNSRRQPEIRVRTPIDGETSWVGAFRNHSKKMHTWFYGVKRTFKRTLTKSAANLPAKSRP